MDDIFINSEKNKSSYPFRLVSNLADEIDLKSSDKYVASSNLSNYYSWENIKKKYSWYFDYIIKMHGQFGNNPPIQIYFIKNERRITFKIKNEFYL